MITRTYDILMPDDNADVDIHVEGDANWGAVGAASVAVASGDTGFYAEWRNRRLRIPIRAGTGTEVAAGFVPRLRLGFGVSLTAVSVVINDVPSVRFSRSLVGDVLSTAAGATTPGDGTFPDTAGGATIRVRGNVSYSGEMFRLTLTIPEAKDEGASPQTS